MPIRFGTDALVCGKGEGDQSVAFFVNAACHITYKVFLLGEQSSLKKSIMHSDVTVVRFKVT